MEKCANLKREMKIRRRLFTFSMKSELIRLFQVLFVQWRQRNVPNKSATRVKLLVLDCFLDLFVAFAVVISETGRLNRNKNFDHFKLSLQLNKKNILGEYILLFKPRT